MLLWFIIVITLCSLFCHLVLEPLTKFLTYHCIHILNLLYIVSLLCMKILLRGECGGNKIF